MPLNDLAPSSILEGIDFARWQQEGAYALYLYRERSEEAGMFLPIPPSTYEDEETPGTFIQPTQSSHFYREVTGLQTKMITLTGTTGVLPSNPVESNQSSFATAQSRLAAPLTGAVAAGADAVQAVGNTFGATSSFATRKATGYAFFHQLRNLLLMYQQRQTGPQPSKSELRFYNFKDQEFYAVEPLSFRRRRQAGRPMMYFYTLTMRVVARRTARPEPRASTLDNVLNGINALNRFRASVFQVAGGLADLAYTAAAVTSSARAQASTISDGDRWQSMWTNATDSVRQAAGIPANSPQAARRAGADANTAGTITQAQASALTSENLPTQNNVRERAIGTSANPGYARSIFDSTRSAMTDTAPYSARMVADPNDPNFQAYALGLDVWQQTMVQADNAFIVSENPAGPAENVLQLLHTLSRLGAARSVADHADLLRSLAEGGAGAGTVGHGLLSAVPSASETLENMVPYRAEAFRDALGLHDPSAYSGVYRRYRVSRGDTPESVAARELGDWRRWIEVVALNGLQYPYFSEDGERQTVAFGAAVLLPVETPDIDVRALRRLEEAQARFDRLSLTDLYLGLDAEVNSLTGDILVSPRNDAALVAGGRAFGQNMRLRLETLTDSWLPNPLVGLAANQVGTKANPFALMLWQGVIESAVLSDVRVERIDGARIKMEGAALRQEVRVRLRGVPEPFTVSSLL